MKDVGGVLTLERIPEGKKCPLKHTIASRGKLGRRIL